MKKLFFISLCIANLLNANPDEKALEIWRKNALKSIEATEKLEFVNYYPQLKSNKKTETLSEIANAAQRKHDYFKNLTSSEFKKIIGKQALKNGGLTSLAVTAALFTSPSLTILGIATFRALDRIDAYFHGNTASLNNLKDPKFQKVFLGSSLLGLVCIGSSIATFKYGKLTFNNIRDLINAEQKLFEKQAKNYNNLRKLEKLQKTISNKDL